MRRSQAWPIRRSPAALTAARTITSPARCATAAPLDAQHQGFPCHPRLQGIATEPTPVPFSGDPVGAQYLRRFLRDVGTFNLGVPGLGNPFGNNIGADEKAAPAVAGGALQPAGDALGPTIMAMARASASTSRRWSAPSAPHPISTMARPSRSPPSWPAPATGAPASDSIRSPRRGWSKWHPSFNSSTGKTRCCSTSISPSRMTSRNSRSETSPGCTTPSTAPPLFPPVVGYNWTPSLAPAARSRSPCPSVCNSEPSAQSKPPDRSCTQRPAERTDADSRLRAELQTSGMIQCASSAVPCVSPAWRWHWPHSQPQRTPPPRRRPRVPTSSGL